MSKQEKIVCAAIRIYFINADKDPDYDTLCDISYKAIRNSRSYKRYHFLHAGTAQDKLGFRSSMGRFVDPVEAMRIAVKAEQVGGILWKKVEARMLNDCGFIDRSKEKGKAIDETIKSYLEFPLKPEDLY